jgi:hypothetical protein
MAARGLRSGRSHDAHTGPAGTSCCSLASSTAHPALPRQMHQGRPHWIRPPRPRAANQPLRPGDPVPIAVEEAARRLGGDEHTIGEHPRDRLRADRRGPRPASLRRSDRRQRPVAPGSTRFASRAARGDRPLRPVTFRHIVLSGAVTTLPRRPPEQLTGSPFTARSHNRDPGRPAPHSSRSARPPGHGKASRRWSGCSSSITGRPSPSGRGPSRADPEDDRWPARWADPAHGRMCPPPTTRSCRPD